MVISKALPVSCQLSLSKGRRRQTCDVPYILLFGYPVVMIGLQSDDTCDCIVWNVIIAWISSLNAELHKSDLNANVGNYSDLKTGVDLV